MIEAIDTAWYQAASGLHCSYADRPVKPPDNFYDDFEEDLQDPKCVQRIYEFSLRQVRGFVEYSDEDDVIQEVFYRLTKWPIGKKYNSSRHYFSLLRITVRQAIAAYWRRRHSQRNDARRRTFISELQNDDGTKYELAGKSENVLLRMQIKEIVKLLMTRVETLTPAERTMFQLRFIDEQSHEEIAEELSVSIRTSYRLESRLRKKLLGYLVSKGPLLKTHVCPDKRVY